MPAAAISGDFADLRTVKSRKVVQLVIEIDVLQAKHVIDTLGFPASDKPIPVAIARLNPVPAPDGNRKDEEGSSLGAGRDTNSQRQKYRYAQASEGEKAVTRAAILSKDPLFKDWAFVSGAQWDKFDWSLGCAEWLRQKVGVDSLSEIATNPHALAFFRSIESEYRQATGRSAEAR